MDIYEKMERIDQIGKECELIYATMEMLRHLAGTVNAETTNRCIMITSRLSERVTKLYSEFKILKKEIGDLAKD